MACSRKQPEVCACHKFEHEDDVSQLREDLLTWYRANGRVLPWRTVAEGESDDEKRGYAIWVSEMMLQQTQVSTVLEYYKKWMAQWPTLQDLSNATLDDVNRAWAGLGYYSRGRRLWEGAKKVVNEMDGKMPRHRASLTCELPGVGKYTASAIASIAFGQRVGVVDGNVIRVLCRLRSIGADQASKPVTDHLWALSDRIVDEEHPGDFNQAVMELGAMICTPKNPQCSKCPISRHCNAFNDLQKRKKENKSYWANTGKVPHQKAKDIEDVVSCSLCLPVADFVAEEGVTNYPHKVKRNIKKDKSTICLIIGERATRKFLLFQRPDSGLLANMLECPCFDEDSCPSNKSSIIGMLQQSFNLQIRPESLTYLDQVVHQFSHIRQTYKVWKVAEDAVDKDQLQPSGDFGNRNRQWLTMDEVKTAAISTAMKKVLHLVAGKKRLIQDEVEPRVKQAKKGQTSIKHFFQNQSDATGTSSS